MRATIPSLPTAVLVIVTGLGGEARAAAQAVRDRPMTPGMYQLSLLAVKEVRDELKLSAEQARKAGEASKKYREALANTSVLSDDARDQTEADRRWRELRDESEKAVADILAPEQIKRFREIRLQQIGAVALADPKLAAELKLTEGQRKAIEVIASDRQKKIKAVMTDSTRPHRETGVKVAELTKAAGDAVRKVLTADQKAQWEALLGKRFHWPVR